MSTMNVSLPQALKDFVDAQVESAGYGTSSEYIRELIRRDMQRLALRQLLADGAGSGFAPAGAAYFEAMRRNLGA
jgi:antitoxin ParD1/3/4